MELPTVLRQNAEGTIPWTMLLINIKWKIIAAEVHFVVEDEALKRIVSFSIDSMQCNV